MNYLLVSKAEVIIACEKYARETGAVLSDQELSAPLELIADSDVYIRIPIIQSTSKTQTATEQPDPFRH